MRFNRAVAVLKTHKRQHDFFSVKGITEALIGDHEKAKARDREHQQDRIIDWLRRPDIEAAGCSDLDALGQHFRGAFKEVEKAAEPGRRKIMGMIRGHARQAIQEIGFDDADADELLKEWEGVSSKIPEEVPNL